MKPIEEQVLDFMTGKTNSITPSQTPEITNQHKQKLEKLQKYIDKVESVMQTMLTQIARGDFEAFSEEDIRMHLSHDPDMIADAGVLLADMIRAYDYAKLDTKTVWAELQDECNKRRDELNLTNQKDREAWVLRQPKYKEALKIEIEYKRYVSLAEVVYKRYEDLFVGSRKIASLLTESKFNYDNGI